MKRKRRFSKIFFLFIAAVVLLAIFTRPSPDAFTRAELVGKSSTMAPMIEYTNAWLYAQVTVQYYEAKVIPDTAAGSRSIVIPAAKEKYIGLMGRFWKID